MHTFQFFSVHVTHYERFKSGSRGKSDPGLLFKGREDYLNPFPRNPGSGEAVEKD